MKLLLLLLLFSCLSAQAQHTFSVRVLDAETNAPLPGATVKAGEQGAITDANGLATLNGLSGSSSTVRVSFVGYEPVQQTFALPQVNPPAVVRLQAGEELEEVIVSATRSSRTIENIPSRIEFLGTEELEEKAIMRSANIAMLLRESTGIQMQQTSLSSANQSIRIQGLDGRYTQLLKDGFPLFGGFAGGLSIMQIPPLDLQQVEIIKGSSSTLYGGGAIAGLVNLVTKTPSPERQLTLMLDQTSAGGTTFNSFYGEQFGKLGLTLFGSANRQQAYDVNEDDFSDLPEIRSLTFNPSFFYQLNESAKVRLTLNGTSEQRRGGRLNSISSGRALAGEYYEENQSLRLNYQLSYTNTLYNGHKLEVRNSLNYFDRTLALAEVDFAGEQWASFSEVTYSFGTLADEHIIGLNVYTDKFNETAALVPRDYSYTTLGGFWQNTFNLGKRFAVESGLRLDYAPDFGAFFLPRLSGLYRFTEKWSARLGGGYGYKLPTIFTEEAESLAYQGIIPISATATEAERSAGLNFDLNFETAIGTDWTFSLNQLFFYTQLTEALILTEGDGSFGSYLLTNAPEELNSRGFETNTKLTYRNFKLFANYAYINTNFTGEQAIEQRELTPRHNFGGVLVYEAEGKWRIGYEAYYTGSQFRRNGSETTDFWLMGLMVLRKFDKLGVYINFENFTDTRQHRLENFDFRRQLAPRLPNIWAPTDGRIVNAGLLLEL